VRRFFGKPKKPDAGFLKTELLDVTFGEKPENREKTRENRKKPRSEKNRYFTKIEQYLI
jgi:hypothetical protein